MRADEWSMIGTMNALNGVTVAPEHVFLARGLHVAGGEAREEEGIDDVSWVPFGEVLTMVAEGRISDGETVAALAFAGIHLGRFR
jgi:hypothetical protein